MKLVLTYINSDGCTYADDVYMGFEDESVQVAKDRILKEFTESFVVATYISCIRKKQQEIIFKNRSGRPHPKDVQQKLEELSAEFDECCKTSNGYDFQFYEERIPVSKMLKTEVYKEHATLLDVELARTLVWDDLDVDIITLDEWFENNRVDKDCQLGIVKTPSNE